MEHSYEEMTKEVLALIDYLEHKRKLKAREAIAVMGVALSGLLGHAVSVDTFVDRLRESVEARDRKEREDRARPQ